MDLSLLEFIPKVSPQLKTPFHLLDWCELIESCLRGGVRALNAVPIRHWKTATTIHGVAWLLCKDPTMRVIYMVADHEMANDWANYIRTICETAATVTGIDISPARGQNVKTNWRNARGGGVQVMSAKQSKLGADIDVLIFDDPLSEHDVDEKPVRDAVDMAIAHYTARSGRPSRRGSVLGVMSRWHPDDPIGRRLLRNAADWVYRHSPAILDDGLPEERAFAPDVMTLEELKLRREELREADPTERLWWSQFQQDPKPTGMSLFRSDPARYVKLPDWNFRLAYGADMAYTSGEGSDYFALCPLKIFGRKAFIIEMDRHKLDAHMIESTCKRAISAHGHAPIFTYVSGPEIGMVKLMRERGVPMVPLRARYNKLVRAQRTIKRWNDFDIEVPESAPWVPGFLNRVEMFRGLEGGHDDDEIDALVSGCDGAMGGAQAGRVKTMGRSYAGIGPTVSRRPSEKGTIPYH